MGIEYHGSEHLFHNEWFLPSYATDEFWKTHQREERKKRRCFVVLRAFISVEKDNEWCFPMQNLGWFGNSDRFRNLDYFEKKKNCLKEIDLHEEKENESNLLMQNLLQGGCLVFA